MKPRERAEKVLNLKPVKPIPLAERISLIESIVAELTIVVSKINKIIQNGKI